LSTIDFISFKNRAAKNAVRFLCRLHKYLKILIKNAQSEAADKKTVDKPRPAWYNKENERLRESVMKKTYESPRAFLAWFVAQDVLMASGETPGGNGGDSFWSEDGTIHLPPVPLG
jgi:hypothetical protein